MRDTFFARLTETGRTDPRIVLLTADLGYKLFDPFVEACPGRFFNMGVSEANMISVAAGLALSGMRPVAYSIAPFATARCYEQIRNDVCAMGLGVLIVSVGGGYAYGVNGPTHHGVDDVALMRALPGMSVYCPCDPNETRAALDEALRLGRPSYLRLGRSKEPILTRGTPALGSGEPTVLRRGDRIALLACGPIAKEALDAAEILARRGIEVHVLSAHTVKPLEPTAAFLGGLRVEEVYVVEEHGPCGGLSEGLSMLFSGVEGAPKIVAVTAPDRFLDSVGSQEDLRRSVGLDAASIAARVVARRGAS